MTRLLPFVLLASLTAAACEPRATEPEPAEPRLAFTSRVDSVGLNDTLTVQVRIKHGRQLMDVQEAPTWRVSNESVMGIARVDGDRVLVFGKTQARAWVIAEAGGMVDSVRLRVVRTAVRVAGFSLVDPGDGHGLRYVPVDGMCFTATNEQMRQMHGRDWWWTQVGGFVVDGAREAMYRTTTQWTYANPGVLLIAPADTANDLQFRPADANGKVVLHMGDGSVTGTISVFVDGEYECRGVIGGLAALPAEARDPEPGYLWYRDGTVATLDGRRIPGARAPANHEP